MNIISLTIYQIKTTNQSASPTSSPYFIGSQHPRRAYHSKFAFTWDPKIGNTSSFTISVNSHCATIGLIIVYRAVVKTGDSLLPQPKRDNAVSVIP
ncbi:hypothetical protein DA076_05410 [Lactiplantibacillus plantarum]|nr:hypothetical protein DA080_05335 [Lactiplantibacillus plantarum]AVW07202.1 hypothetical protein DA076_05410 [Lactiplantibacillus plantarum]